MRIINHPWYSSICEEFYKKFNELDIVVTRLRNERSDILRNTEDPENPPNRYYEISYELLDPERELEKNGLISVLMATMFAEAFINDYASKSFGNSYFNNYVDRLSLLSKWVLVPKLKTKKDFPTNSQAFEYLNKLVSVRNDVVHFKSKEAFGHDELRKIHKKNYQPFIEAANISFKAIQELIRELKKLDPEYFNNY